jgi:hypothetical protein
MNTKSSITRSKLSDEEEGDPQPLNFLGSSSSMNCQRKKRDGRDEEEVEKK